MTGQMPGSNMQDMYPRGPPSGMGMGSRPQYPYNPGFERRWDSLPLFVHCIKTVQTYQSVCNVYVHRPDHVMGAESGIVPPGNQNNLVPSNSDPSMYSGSRYPSHQR